MPDLCQICNEVKEIVGGKAECEEEACSVSISRKNLHATIEGRQAASGEAIGIQLQFQDLGADGRALCLGEVTLLDAEVEPFVRDLSRRGIRLTAIHNHWLEEQPRLIYVHFQAVMDPRQFARALAPALKRLAQ